MVKSADAKRHLQMRICIQQTVDKRRFNMSKIKIDEMIKKLRCDKGISQEMLANVCDVSMQAVSKWENGQSCPDISFLPLLAEYFQVSIDYLLTGKTIVSEDTDDKLTGLLKNETKEDILYIIQYRNGKILDKKQWDREQMESRRDAVRIQFEDEFQHLKSGLHIEVWGNANIEAVDADMDLTTGGNVNCGTVNGDINAGAAVNCGTVQGDVSAGYSVNCSTIEGDTSAGCNVNCSVIEGNASAGCSISCGTIKGSAKAGMRIEN